MVVKIMINILNYTNYTMAMEYSTQIITQTECPFCKEGKINVIRKPSIIKLTSSRSAAGTKRKAYRTPEGFEVTSEKCPVCGKSRQELKHALESGVPPSKEEMIKRAKEAGLPLKF